MLLGESSCFVWGQITDPLHRLSNCSCEPRHTRDLTENMTGDPIRALLRVEGHNTSPNAEQLKNCLHNRPRIWELLRHSIRQVGPSHSLAAPPLGRVVRAVLVPSAHRVSQLQR